MKSAEAWLMSLEVDITIRDIEAIQSDATADLQSQVEQLRGDIEAYRGALGYSIPGDCDGKLSDGTIPQCGMCNSEHRKEAEKAYDQHHHLRTALEKCVVALESEPFHSWRVKEAINTAKPLLNKP